MPAMSVQFSSAGGEASIRFAWPPPPEKDEVKRLGAQWDPIAKVWHLPLTSRSARWLADHGVQLPAEQAAQTAVPATARLAHPEITAPDQPPGLAVELFPYQREGVAFLDSVPRALLADETGVGKTFQFLVAARHTGRAIILTPTSSAWQTVTDGLLKLWPDLPREKIVVLAAGSGKKHQAMLDRLPEAQWIVCPYSLVSKYAATLSRLPGTYTLVADEAQALKNVSAQRSKAAQLLASRASRVILATGTPLMNQKPIELYPLLQLLGNPLHMSYPQFGMRYCAGTIEKGFTRRDGRRVPDHYDFTGASNLAELQERLASFTIRRSKAAVLSDLPPKVLTRVPVELPAEYQRQYNTCAADYLAWREQYRPDLTEPLKPNAPIDLMLPGALRQIAANGKSELAVEWVNEFLESTAESGRKLIVFSDYLEPLATVRAGLQGTESITIDGEIAGEQREAARRRFQEDPNVRVCLAQTQTAGVALTLTAADTVLFLNMPWRAMDVSQAFDRIHRPGQQAQSVQAVFLEMRSDADADNIDTALYHLVLGKQQIADAIFGKGNTDLAEAATQSPDDVKRALIGRLGLQKTVAKAERQIRKEAAAKLPDPFTARQQHRDSDLER